MAKTDSFWSSLNDGIVDGYFFLMLFHVFQVYLSQLALLLEEKNKYIKKHAFPTTSCIIIIQDQTYLNCTHKEHN